MSTLENNIIYSTHEDNPIYMELVGEFVKSIDEKKQEFLDAVNSKDRKNMLAVAHKFKGNFATYGFSVVAQIIEKIEAALKDPQQWDNIQSDPQFIELLSELLTVFSLIKTKN